MPEPDGMKLSDWAHLNGLPQKSLPTLLGNGWVNIGFYDWIMSKRFGIIVDILSLLSVLKKNH